MYICQASWNSSPFECSVSINFKSIVARYAAAVICFSCGCVRVFVLPSVPGTMVTLLFVTMNCFQKRL